MDTIKTLPTNPLTVESWLRSFSTPEQIEQGGTYPYLFGMATVKLAEAHAEIERLKLARARRRVGGSNE